MANVVPNAFKGELLSGTHNFASGGDSFKLALLTLMNTVNSSAYGVSDFDFQNLHFLTKYFLIFFMIIGRVELLSLLLIAKKFLFKN